MQCRTVGFVKPVARVERQELDLRPVWQIRRLVYEKPASMTPHVSGITPTGESSARSDPPEGVRFAESTMYARRSL